MNNNEKLFEDVLRELNTADVIDDFKYKSIVNLDQFNEGLEYLIDQINLISETIDDMTDKHLVSFGVLNESNSLISKDWESAKKKINVRREKVSAISSVLENFLIGNPISKRGIKYKVTRENCIQSQSLVEKYTKFVNFTSESYYDTAKKFKTNPYSLYDIIRIYNLSVTCFNRVLNNSRARFDISLDELPDASVL